MMGSPNASPARNAVFLRTPYNYDASAVSRSTGLDCSQSKDRTQQNFKEECDINTLVQRFGIGYQMPEGLVAPQYGDFSHISDYHQALNQIAAARETFEQLPAHVRDRFQNDPGRFVDFSIDPANAKELVKLGLATERKESPEEFQARVPNPPPQPTQPAPSPAAPAA